MKGRFGRFLEVSLTEGRVTNFSVPDEWYGKYLGGKGLGARILLEELEPNIKPFGPENMLVFATGPFQGVGVSGGGRHVVMAKSPKTHSINGSYVGGYFGRELGSSGYDGIIIRGSSRSPKYLVLKEGRAEIKDASKLWGKETASTEKAIRKREGDVRVATIGKAGENLINFSSIIHDNNRSAGRSGLGAIMGSKKLKAVCVGGYKQKLVDNQRELESLKRDLYRRLKATKQDFLGQYGTAGGLLGLNEEGILPTKNFQQGEFARAEEISGERMANTILKKREGCSGCPVKCKRVVETEFNGEKVRPEYGGPEYESIAAFGSLCLNSNLDSVALANQKCNQYGLDTISTGNIIAFAMEASEKGLIKKKIDWGDPKVIIKLVEEIASRRGLGKKLAKGLGQLKQEFGVDFAVEIKGQEVPMHDPRGKKGLGISYATTPQGANHMEGMHDTMLEETPPVPELGINEPMDRFSYKGKAEVAKTFEDLRSFNDSLIICEFTVDVLGENHNFQIIRDILKSITGERLTMDEVMRIGERNYMLFQLLANREIHSEDKDDLPKRLKEPLPSGATKGEGIPENKLDFMLTKYYEQRGYDEDGNPTEKKLAELGLGDVV